MSGDDRIDVSPDGKHLLLSVQMSEEHNRKDWDGPQPALWSFDLTTQKSVRLIPKKLFAWDGCWIDDTNILFLSQRDPKGARKRAFTLSNVARRKEPKTGCETRSHAGRDGAVNQASA